MEYHVFVLNFKLFCGFQASSKEVEKMQSSDEDNSVDDSLSSECDMSDEPDKNDSENEELRDTKRKNEVQYGAIFL